MEETIKDPCRELTTPERVNYFAGKLLTEEDLRQDQSYRREKHKGHLRYLHGYGTVCGLRVVPYGTEKPTFIKVEPGAALDIWGREIVVPEEVALDLSDYAQENGAECYVVLEYREYASKPVPQPGKLLSEESKSPSRILESFDLTVKDKPPPKGAYTSRELGAIFEKIKRTKPEMDHLKRSICEIITQPCSPCAEDPAVILAKLTLPPNGPITDAHIDNCTLRPVVLSTDLLLALLLQSLGDRVD